MRNDTGSIDRDKWVVLGEGAAQGRADGGTFHC